MPLSIPIGPHPFSREIIRMVREYDASRPRSMQKHLGPSEIGTGCDRQLAYKLAGREPVNETADPWFPIIGSAVHEWLSKMATYYNDVVLGRHANPRFIVENRVKVATQQGGYDTSGHTDLYDVDNERVVDWKIVGATTMRKVKDGDPAQYKIQAMTYGTGWVQAGYPVREVMIAYLPRSNFLNKMHLNVHPYDPTITPLALQRVGTIEAMVQAGIPPEAFGAADCTIWCPFYRPKVELGHSSCPGHGAVKDD